MEFKGYDVFHVVNVTDLDDSTIEGAEESGMPLKDFTETYFKEFLRDLETLNIKRASDYPRASDHVDDMIELARKLIEKGYAYEKLRSIYFDISRFRDYGKLSKIDLDKIHLGKTVDLEQYEKENPRDFTLLKRSTLRELKNGIFYKTQWGNIRPSWHLECPAMAMKLLGGPYDLHTSGVDLIFPHHENAIAISEAVLGQPLANYWLHNEVVTVNGKKLSRDMENHGLTIRELLEKGFTGREIRYWLLSRHYRKSIVFSWKNLKTAKNTLSHLDQFVNKLYHCPVGSPDPDMAQRVYDVKHKFVESLDDDFSIAPALAALFEFAREINKVMDRQGLSSQDKERVTEVLKSINSVLGIMDLDRPGPDEEVDALLRRRQEAREAKDWPTADRIRQQLKAMGIEVTDTKEGTIWRRKKDPMNPKK
jgi:cysteinyl-tRNA synthetase